MNKYKPMLAETTEAPFNSVDWLFEVKWDGIRAISYVYNELSIMSRNGKELMNSFPELAELKELAKDVTLDGEIVVLKDGKVDFQSLIKRLQKTSPRDIEFLWNMYPVTYVIFDILEKNEVPLINRPLSERKRILKESVHEGKSVVLSLFVEAEGEAYYNAAVGKGLEGVVAKRKDSRYEPGERSRSWLKVKMIRTCECVVLGYTRGEGSRKRTFGALLLGLYDGDKLTYVGKVGTGFDQKQLEELTEKFKGLQTGLPFKGVDVGEEVTWLRPEIVCEVAYQLVTDEGKLRLARFHGLRFDKKPMDCTLDQVKPRTLGDYLGKRDFSKTPEPGDNKAEELGGSFVVQEHNARQHHFDFRLEKEGVLKSWAVPKGLPDRPGAKRLAVRTEDHPLEYAGFEGTIPKGQYGAGVVKIWDTGFYKPIVWSEDKVEFVVKGERLSGRFVLVRIKKAEKNSWLFLKGAD